jgi:hypothetical protein
VGPSWSRIKVFDIMLVTNLSTVPFMAHKSLEVDARTPTMFRLSDNIRNCYNVGFKALTAVVTNSFIFWDVTTCSPLKVNRRFGGT